MWCQCKLWLFSAFFASFSVLLVTAFNVDSFNYASYNGPDSASMFGFSLAVHKESNNGWLIVGAPEAQSSYQHRVFRGGAVYKCPTDRDGNCDEIPFDQKDDNIDKDGQHVDNKTEQWFGATVSASGAESGPVVACAPRYTWYPKRKTRRDPVGTCYVSNGVFNEFNEYAPCRTFQWGYHRQGSCQAGFSAAINSKGDRLFVGSPGSWYWQGQMYSIDAHAKFEFKPLYFSGTYGSKGQVHQQSLEQRPAVFSTTEGTEQDDDSYMGYSTIVGDFVDDADEEQGIAVGMPRGNNLLGKVLLFTLNLTNFLHHFTSDQIGSYYGYALAASDVDGDGKVDLIIGAPMYTPQNNEGKYDVGRVYVVYHQSDKGKFVATYEIDGFNTKSRFGQALAALGDINQDGFGDFAVGAPYDGPDERGAVYIYHGSSKGVRKKFSQVIFAEDVVPAAIGALRTFGFSITGGLDLDGNEYPDMAVGAYLSNQAFFFRSRPVVIVEAAVKFLTDNKEIDIKKSNYELRSGNKATVTKIDFCIKYHGKGIPRYIDLGLQYILDSKKLTRPRMGFVDHENQNIINDTIRIYKDRNDTCIRKDVYVLSEIRDKLTSLVAEVKYWMQDEARSSYYALQRNPRSVLKPILDLNSPPSRKDSISVHKECGDDNICIPNLVLKVKPSVDKYLLGSKEHMFLEVLVSNTGEDSFETTLDVKYPENVFYVRTKDEKVESHVLCNTHENNTLKCEIGNPIPKDKVVHFKIFWQPTYKVGMSPTYDFQLLVNSTNQELESTRKDNMLNISVGIWSNSRLDIRGKSHPGEVFFNSSLYTADISRQSQYTLPTDRLDENTIGPQVIHVYYLRNEGPATIDETEIFFVWPAATLGDEDLLYLLEPPHFSPKENIQCDPIPANYRAFHVDISQKTIWERLNLDIESESRAVSGQVGAVVGGGFAKTEESLNTAVDKSDDSSKVQQHRHNITQHKITSTGTLGTDDGRSTSSSTKYTKYTSGGITQTIVSNQTHYRNASGVYVSSTGQMVSQNGGAAAHGGTIWEHGEDNTEGGVNKAKSNTRIQYTSSGKTISEGESSLNHGNSDFSVTRQELGEGKYQQQQIGNRTFIYRCLQRINGREEEVECGPNFSLPTVDSSLLANGQVIGNTQYQCFEEVDGKWTSVNCNRQHQQQGGVQQTGGSQMETKVNIIHKCKEERDGRWYDVECGPDGAFPDLSQYQSRYGGELHEVSGGAKIIHDCFKIVNGNKQKIPCDFAGISHLNNTYNFQQRGGQGSQFHDQRGSSSSQFNQQSATTSQHNRQQVSGGYQSEYERQRVENERRRLEEERQRAQQAQYGQHQVQFNRTEQHQSSSQSDYERQRAEYQRTLEEYERRRAEYERQRAEEERNRAAAQQQTHTGSQGSYGNYGTSQGSYGSTQRNSASSQGAYGGAASHHNQYGHHTGSQYTGSQSGARHETSGVQSHYGGSQSHSSGAQHEVSGNRQHEEGNYNSGSYEYEDEDEEESGGKAISGYINPNRQEQQSVGGRRDPKTYGKYDESRSRAAAGQTGAAGAALGNEFSVTTLELGNLGGGKMEGGHQQSSGAGRGQEWREESHWSETREIPPTYFNTVERDNVPTDKPTSKNRFYGRKKRDILKYHASIAEIRDMIRCNAVHCIYMRCTVSGMEKDKEIAIALRARINARVLRNVSSSEPLSFSSVMAARINKLPYIGTPAEQILHTHEIFSTVSRSESEIKPDVVPLWVVVLSAVAGTIILLLLVFLLYKVGFFKRNRPSSAPERQPLNRNGYHHGDEAL